ncbi:hypothetical protein [Lysinibacillus endophyticus]|uniref:hypothetical protein n=1 Tax=Ureibacillus endophyticus TaxID=1978490 RepID=UPI0031376313
MDWISVISAIATSIAAISAAISAYQSRMQTKILINEKHAMVKPLFRTRSIFEKRVEKLIEINVKNVGYSNYMHDIEVYWVGTSNVQVAIKDFGNLIDSNEFQLFVNFTEVEEQKEIYGALRICYKDILGKMYDEKIIINVQYKYYELTEEYVPEYTSDVHQYFK